MAGRLAGKPGFRRLLVSSPVVILFALCAGVLGCQKQSPPPAQNLLQNPGFEEYSAQSFPHWAVESWKAVPEGLVRADPEVFHAGASSLRITHSAPNDTSVTQHVTVRPGKTYKLSGWIKTQGVQAPEESAGGASVGICGTWTKTAWITGDSEWRLVELDVKPEKNQRELAICCRLGFWGNATVGTAWFDDIRLEGASPDLLARATAFLEKKSAFDVPLKKPLFLLLGVIGGLTLLGCTLRALEARGLAAPWTGLAVFATFLGLYGLTSFVIGKGPLAQSQYPHYVHLADAFAHGRLHLLEPLYEVATFGEKIYIMEAVFPAILLLPFAAVWGKGFPDILFLSALGAVNATLVFMLWPKLNAFLKRSAVSSKTAFWLTVLFALGTPHWYQSVGGRVWHTAAIVTVFCLLLAMHETLGKARGSLTGLYVGWAFLSHGPAVFSVLFFLVILGYRWRVERNSSWRRVLSGFAALSLVLALEFAVGFALYNYVRYGSWFEMGQVQLYERDISIGIQPPTGMLNARYLARHFWNTVLRVPLPAREFPFFTLDPEGFSFFLATPAFFLVFLTLRRDVLVLASWLGAVPVLTVLLMFRGTGWTQFAYRWVLDFLPFLMVLTALGVKDMRRRIAYALIGVSIYMNLAGTLWFHTHL